MFLHGLSLLLQRIFFEYRETTTKLNKWKSINYIDDVYLMQQENFFTKTVYVLKAKENAFADFLIKSK